MPGSGLTIRDEVKESAWSDAAMLIRHVLEHERDVAGFHQLEDQMEAMHSLSWQPQALACVAARLLTDLAAVKSMPPGDLLTQIMNSGSRYGP